MTAGVLLMAYGGPRSLDEVEPYFAEIRGGRPPSRVEVEELQDRYRRAGGASPLLDITLRQAQALQSALEREEPGRFKAYVGMKHWHPFIREAAQQIAADGVERVIGLVLAPHYSKMSIGGYEQRVLDARAASGADFEFEMIPSWYDEPAFVDLVAANLRATLADWGDARVFFTAHSLPERIVAEGDPYRDQLLHSSKLIAEAAAVDEWEFAFQSASTTGEPWLGPDVLGRLEEFKAGGGRRAVVAPIGFVADHLEVLYDVDVECAEKAAALGLDFRRIPSPNDDPRFIEALVRVVLSRG